MIKVIHMFHDSMGACVQLDDGDLSAWFIFCQEFRQGCVLSPLLFSIGGNCSGSAEVRGGPADRFGLGVPR